MHATEALMQRKEAVVWVEETAKEVFDLCISQKATENVNNCLFQSQLTVIKKQLNTFITHMHTPFALLLDTG